jgi:predicted DNA binding protein
MVAAPKPDGTVDWQLTVTMEGALDNLLTELHRNKAAPSVLRISGVSDGDSLTVYQHRIIEKAFLEGFFEYPRKSGLDELSEHIGISSSSLSETIRRAEKKIIARYLRHSADPLPDALAAAYDGVRPAP